MSVANYTTANSAVLRLPLAELAKPENLKNVLEFVARHAPPCIAEGLLSKLIADLITLTGCTRKAAISFLNRIIRYFA